jgi:hypothetical protein
MNKDTDAAEFYERHKDDPEVWGEPVEAPMAKRHGGLGATITVRFSEEEAELLRSLAARLDMTYSELVRKAVNDYIRPRVTIQAGVS